MAPLTKLIYKPDTQSTEEYMIMINSESYKKWQDGDTVLFAVSLMLTILFSSMPLADIVDSFNIYHTAQGSQGLLGKPSNQQLDTVFGTHKDVEVIDFIMKNGKEQKGELATNVVKDFNAGRGTLYPSVPAPGQPTRR
ncbi:hypothetical protein BJ912DRAFT_1052087 [Pholiota molesta]|nr:hypothetical protein BJ912DRAFT_1052087 [Pholiota molesta]